MPETWARVDLDHTAPAPSAVMVIKLATAAALVRALAVDARCAIGTCCSVDQGVSCTFRFSGLRKTDQSIGVVFASIGWPIVTRISW